MLNYIIGCIIILIAAVTVLIGQFIGTVSGGLDEFQTDALKQYPELKIKKPLPTFEEFCYPKNYAVQKQQKFASEYMKKSKSRELLVFHKIGAGKTCVAIQIGERFKSKGRILAIMPASLIPGFRNELRSNCANNEYITNKDRDKLKKLQPGSIEYKEIIVKSDELIDKIWQIYSYNKFATSNKEIIAPLIVVDEVQNLSGQGFFYKSIVSWIDLNPTARVVIMSGTPLFDSLNEIYPIAKLLRINTHGSIQHDSITAPRESIHENELVITPENIKDLFSGKVSYFSGAPDYTFPESSIKIKKCIMSKFQSKWYLAQVEAEMGQTGYIKLIEVSDNFYVKSRQRSNIVYPNGFTDQDGLDSLKSSIIRSSLDVYSCKYAALIKKLRKNMLSFVYTAFTGFGGIKALIKCLKVFGYKNFLEDGPGKHRFAIWSGDQTNREKDIIRATFNSSINDNSGQIQIVIGSPSIKEGVSLLRVRHVHILEAYWNHSRLEQIYGRAVRFCSHKTLPKDERNVIIYIYAAICGQRNKKITPKESIDLYMLEMADKKKDEMAPYVLALQDVAVDRLLFS